MKNIYIVLSQSGTIMSKCIKMFTRDKYNHVSLSFDPDLETMYSFARINPNFPFPGGFVEEGKNRGIFKKHLKTIICVRKIEVADDKYEKIQSLVNEFLSKRKYYKYNYRGVFSALLKRDKERKRHYYCSQFVKSMLIKSEIIDKEQFNYAMRPMDFLRISSSRFVYSGLFKDYTGDKT